MKYKAAVSVFIFVIFMLGVLCGYLITYHVHARYAGIKRAAYTQMINDNDKNIIPQDKITNAKIKTGIDVSDR